MAGKHGGGSWKVAYADFVTAMMAFFLVMWIGAQDQKTRQSVANYFLDPDGVSKKPAKAGSVMDSVQYGSLSDQEKTAMGRGRQPFSPPREPSPATKKVSDWVHADPATLRRWREQAQACRELAARSPEVMNQTAPLEAVAARELANRFREAMAAEAAKTAGLQQNLFVWSLGEVNWVEIAEDLLRE